MPNTGKKLFFSFNSFQIENPIKNQLTHPESFKFKWNSMKCDCVKESQALSRSTVFTMLQLILNLMWRQF